MIPESQESGPSPASAAPAQERHIATKTLLSPEDLQSAGTLLFGDRWQTDLARALGVSDRYLRYWMDGKRRVPTDARQKVRDLLQERAGLLLREAERLA